MAIKHLCACSLEEEQQLIPRSVRQIITCHFDRVLLEWLVLLDWSVSHYEVKWLHVTLGRAFTA